MVVEEQSWYYLTHLLEDKDLDTYISPEGFFESECNSVIGV